MSAQNRTAYLTGDETELQKQVGRSADKTEFDCYGCSVLTVWK